jgi:PAS domain S-box-containing protein
MKTNINHRFLMNKNAFFIYDDKGNILHSNSAFHSLCGFNNQEIRGKSYDVMVGPLTDKNDLNDMRNRLETGLPVKSQMINYRKNGNAFVNRMTMIPMYNCVKQKDNTYIFNNTAPCQFVAHVDLTPDLHDIVPLTEKEKKERNLNTSFSSWGLFR